MWGQLHNMSHLSLKLILLVSWKNCEDSNQGGEETGEMEHELT